MRLSLTEEVAEIAQDMDQGARDWAWIQVRLLLAIARILLAIFHKEGR